MEKTNIQILRQYIKEYKIKPILITLFSVIIVLYIIIYGISPLKKIKELNNIAVSDSVYMQKEGNACNNYTLYDISRIKAFKEALYIQSKDDSIGLIINIKDSLISLAIKGVIIHSSKINDYKVDKTLKDIMNASYVKIFSYPIEVISDKATIVKEPIIIKKAPKDTIEAAKMIYAPDTLKRVPSFIKFNMEHSIDLLIEQSESYTLSDFVVRLKFKSGIYLSNFFTNIGRMLVFKHMEYKPWIKVKIPSEDVSTIYRALSINPRIVISF